MKTCNYAMINAYFGIIIVLIILHRSLQTVKFSLKSFDLCKFTTWSPDVLADSCIPDLIRKF